MGASGEVIVEPASLMPNSFQKGGGGGAAGVAIDSDSKMVLPAISRTDPVNVANRLEHSYAAVAARVPEGENLGAAVKGSWKEA